MSARRRVVLFSTGHTDIGGCGRHSSLLAAGLAERGWDVRVISRAAASHRPRLRRRPGLTVIEVPGGHRLGAVLYLVCATGLGMLWGRRAVFMAFQLGSPVLAAGLCARLWSRPSVALSTSNGEQGEVLQVLRSPWRGLHRRMLREATRLVGQTDAARGELETLTEPQRVVVIPNPVELPALAPPLDGRPRAVYTGRLAEEKGLGFLLDAWAMVAAGRPGARLTLVGEGGRFGSVEAELRARTMGDATLRESVTFTGWVQDVNAFLLDADVFVLPSLWEGLSNALLEACAQRRLVVASDIPGNTAILGSDHPFLFAPGDADGLARALAEAFDDASARADARRRVDEAVERFGLEQVLNRYEAMLAEALAGSALYPPIGPSASTGR